MHVMKRALPHFVLLALLLALVPATAAATAPITIVRDCADSDSLEGSYSNSDLQKALKLVRGDLAEYSNCKAIIAAAKGGGPKAKAAGKDGGRIDPDLNGDGVVTPRERRIAKQRERAARRESRELAAIGDTLSPDGDSAAGGGSGSSSGGLLSDVPKKSMTLSERGPRRKFEKSWRAWRRTASARRRFNSCITGSFGLRRSR